MVGRGEGDRSGVHGVVGHRGCVDQRGCEYNCKYCCKCKKGGDVVGISYRVGLGLETWSGIVCGCQKEL